MGGSDVEYAQNPSGFGSDPSGQALSEGRRINVQVRDATSTFIEGCDIQFFIADPPVTPLGGVSKSRGHAALTVPDDSVVIGVSVTVDAATQTVLLPPGQNDYTFVFQQAPSYPSLASPRARCPDGTSGQPCVDCKIGGITIRICVV